MRLVLALIRSGATQSGADGRQLGPAEEPLLETERLRLRLLAEQGHYPSIELAYVSPALRCRETREAIYPRTLAIVSNDLGAFDAGAFSAKTHAEILRTEGFSQWAESHRFTPCPDGENLHNYTIRCAKAFRAATQELTLKGIHTAAVITHDLAISAIMRRYSIPRSNYRDWSCGWGGGYLVEYDSISQAVFFQAEL